MAARRRRPLALWAACLAVPLLGCNKAVHELGAPGEAARRNTGDLVGSLAVRFGPTEREPAFDALRPVLARYALAPSRIFDAPALWTNVKGSTRGVAFRGRRVQGRYRMGLDRLASAPVAPGDYRGEWRLERLREDEFEWMAREELAVGNVSADDLSRALTEAFLELEAAGSGDLAPRLRSELPRTAAALAPLASLESVDVRRDSEGCATVTLAARLHPDGIRPFAPLYAHYFDDVVLPTRFTAAATDPAGGRWWDIAFSDGRVLLHLRVHRGDLAPLEGPPRAIPASLRVTVAGSSRTGFLRSGFHDLEVDLDLTRLPGEKGFVARFTKAPEWDLPFLVPLLLRGALHRPFEGEGALLSIGIEMPPGGPTLLTRDYRVAVRENWLVRWIGGYVAGAISTYRKGEAEADRFNAEALLALREDALALLAQP